VPIGFGFYINGPTSYAHLAWEDSIPAVARAGFASLDVSATNGVRVPTSEGFTADERRRLRALADRAGLSIAAVPTHPGLTDTLQSGSPLDLRGAIDVARDLGSPLVLHHIGGHATAPRDEEHLWDAAVTHVRDACEYGVEFGIGVCLDAVAPDFLTSSPAEVRRFLVAVDHPNVGWNFDPAYLVACGFDVAATVELLGTWIRHAHIKDVRGTWPAVEWLVPGDGDLDQSAWAAALAGIGFDGAIASEPIARPKGAPERWSIDYACARSMATFRAAFDAAAPRIT
jgi:sugar phosphate isomerase/epimerase